MRVLKTAKTQLGNIIELLGKPDNKNILMIRMVNKSEFIIA